MSNYFFSTSNRIKSTPFTSRNNLAGVKKYTAYNNTLIPTVFKSLEDDYNHLINKELWISYDGSLQLIDANDDNTVVYQKRTPCSNISDAYNYYTMSYDDLSPRILFENGSIKLKFISLELSLPRLINLFLSSALDGGNIKKSIILSFG